MNRKIHALLYSAVALFTAAIPMASAGVHTTPQQLATLKVLDLGTAKVLAVTGNPSLLAMKERIEQARQQVRQEKAAWLPSLDAETSLTREDNSTSSGGDDAYEAYKTSLIATLTLFDGFNRTHALDSATQGESVSFEEEKDARRLLLFNVAQSYYSLQSAAADIAIARSDRAYNARQLTEAEARHNVGAGSLSDVLNFKIQVNTASATLMDVEKTYAIALTGLATLMGVEKTAFQEGMSLTPLQESGDWNNHTLVREELVRIALVHRPDLAQNHYVLEQTTSAIGIARADYYPTVSLSGIVSGARNGSAAYDSDDQGNSIAITMAINLFAGGETRAKVAKAEATRREALYTLQDLRLTVRQEVSDALEEFKTALKQVALQVETVTLTRQNRDLVEQEYRAGLTSVVQLNEAQNNLVSAQGNLVTARVTLHTAWETIQKVTASNLI
ncbi:TolC family protein [Desulfoluna sp.]|uniref:TolC family protein n=1 Tax=Desulfoluna sp. TaxID=2045199 RepID=UPI002624E642|nr:TolC family protein [Desulfoluna sp.]